MTTLIGQVHSGLKKMSWSQELRGSRASWTCCISGRRLQSVRLPSLFMKECHFWSSTYLMDLLGTQVTSLSLYPDNTLHSRASFSSPGLTFRASKEYNYTLWSLFNSLETVQSPFCNVLAFSESVMSLWPRARGKNQLQRSLTPSWLLGPSRSQSAILLSFVKKQKDEKRLRQGEIRQDNAPVYSR